MSVTIYYITLRRPCYAHFQVYTFILGVYWNRFKCFNIKTPYSLISSASEATSGEMFRFSPVLSKAPLLKIPVCSDWSALTGLSRQTPLKVCPASSMFIASSWLHYTCDCWNRNLTLSKSDLDQIRRPQRVPIKNTARALHQKVKAKSTLGDTQLNIMSCGGQFTDWPIRPSRTIQSSNKQVQRRKSDSVNRPTLPHPCNCHV